MRISNEKQGDKMALLEDILQLQYIQGLDLLTVPQTIDNKEVSSVDITETPDIEHYVNEGTLILTTAMIFQENQQGLIPFIDSLIRSKVAGLAIKTNRFLNGHINQEVIDYSNQHNFPIINIPEKYPLGPLLHQLSNFIWDRRQEEIVFALDIQGKFSNLILNNASIEQTLNEFSKSIQCPVLLLDPFKERIAHSRHYKYHRDDLETIVQHIQHQFKNQTIPDDYALISIDSESSINVSISPLHIFKHYPHYLLVLSPESMPYPISHFVIEQASLVISFILYKNNDMTKLYHETISNYFLDYFQQNNTDATHQQFLTEKLGLRLSDYYQAISINESEHTDLMAYSIKLQEKYLLLSLWLEKHLNAYFNNAILIEQPNELYPIIILQERVPHLEKTLTQLNQDISKNIDIRLQYNMTQPVDNVEDLSDIINQANIAYKHRLKEQLKDTFYYYSDSVLSHLFHSLDSHDIQYFCKNILKELAYPDNEEHMELRKTLKIYLDNQCETTATANLLFIHRNTVNYRIEKCEKILGRNIRHPKNSLEIRLALKFSEKKLYHC